MTSCDLSTLASMSRIARLLIGSSLLAAVASPSATAQTDHFPNDDDLRTIVRYLVEDTPVAGMVLGVLEADGSTRIVSYGTAGPEAPALSPESGFEIGSITKTFTGTLLADLVMRGVVSLEDPVQMYVPDSVRIPTRGARSITLLDLATHHSGLPRVADNHEPSNPGDPYSDYTLATMYAFLSEHDLRRDPGSEYEYSNLGFQLLGHAIARASGASLTELVDTRVLGPLGMTATGYDLEAGVADRMARGHRRLSVTSFNTGGEARRGAGGLRSNAVDLLEYLKANVGPAGTHLEDALRLAHEPRRPFGSRGAMIGLGWVTTEVAGTRIIEHGGGTGGFTSRIAFDPEREVGYVLLTNSRLFSDPTANEMLGFGPPLDFPASELGRDLLSEFVGAYRFGPEEALYVRLEPEGYLTLQATGRARARLYARADSTFFLKQAPITLSAERNGGGDIIGLLYRANSNRRTATRTDDQVPEPQAVRAGSVWAAVSLEWARARRSVVAVAGGVLLLIVLLLGLQLRRRGDAA